MIHKRYYPVIFLSLIFSAIVAGVSLYALQSVKSDTLRKTGDSLSVVLESAVASHQAWSSERNTAIADAVSSAKVVNASRQLLEIKRDFESPEYNDAARQFSQVLTPSLKKFTEIDYFLIAQDRITLAASRVDRIGKQSKLHQKSNTLLNRAFSGKLTIIPSVQSNTHWDQHKEKTDQSSRAVFLAIPLIVRDDNTLAVLVVHLHPYTLLSRIAKLSRVGTTGETYIFDEDGVLLTGSRFEHQLQTIGQPTGLPLTKMAKSAIHGSKGKDLKGYRDYRGVTVVGAWDWIEEYQIGIATEINLYEALAPYYYSRNAIVAIMITVLALAFSMLYILYKMEGEAGRKVRRAYSTLEDRVKDRTRELAAAKDSLTVSNQQLEKLATTDGLTGLANRRHFNNCLINEWRRGLRDSNTLSVILFDIDYFKLYNDHYGHIAGDACLEKIADALQVGHFVNRPGDILARYGGEEFVVLLPNADPGYVARVAEGIRAAIFDLHIHHEATGVEGLSQVTVSVGYATLTAVEDTEPDLLVERADIALYKAKEEGRNCVVKF